MVGIDINKNTENVCPEAVKRIVLTFFLALTAACTAIQVEANSDRTPPEGFELQRLESTGGDAYKPLGWFFAERHKSKTELKWVISKENIDQESNSAQNYETGLAIYFWTAVERDTGRTPREFANVFIRQISRGGQLLGSTCNFKGSSTSSSMCFNTRERVLGKEFRVRHIIHWWPNYDMVAHTIAGTTPESWDLYSDTFETMSNIRFLGQSR